MTESDNQLQIYLDIVRDHLRDLSAAEVHETVEELRCHVLDRLDGDSSPGRMGQALITLGDPVELARINVRERMEARRIVLPERRTRFEFAVLFAATAVKHLFSLAACLAGLSISVFLIACAAAKPFMPARVGLWWLNDPIDPYSFSLGRVATPPAGRELLGWWLIAVCIILAAVIGGLTYQFSRYSIRHLANVRFGREA